METLLDKMFGNKNAVHQLLKGGHWEEAARYGDEICYLAVTKNEDWIWQQFADIKQITANWNSTSFGNVAVGIHYGAAFVERAEEINRLKNLFLCARG